MTDRDPEENGGDETPRSHQAPWVSRSPWRGRAWIALFLVGLAGVAAIVLVVLNLSDIGAFAAQAARAQLGWFALALFSQLATYGGVAYVWMRVLGRIDHSRPYWSLYPLSVAKLFADQAVPSGGVSGAVFFLHALGRRGVPAEAAFSVFVFATASFFAAFLIAAMVSLFAVAGAEAAPPALAASIAAFAALLLTLIIMVFAVFVLRITHTPDWASRIPYFDKAATWVAAAAAHIGDERRLFLEATAAQFAVRMVDGLTLFFAFLAIGDSAAFGVCFIAVVIASLAATLGPIPMGLGTFEAGMITTLTVFGAPIESALTATLMFRGLSLWLPLAPGFYIIQREILGPKKAPG